MKSPVRQAADRYRRWKNLYYYSLGKAALDPAYPAVAALFRGSSRPLLDLGCGMGLLTAYLRASGHAAHVIGIELDAEKVDVAREVLGEADAEFHPGDAFSFPPHQGDVVMLDVIHYFDDAQQQALLVRIAESLAPGGIAAIRFTLNERHWRFALTRAEEWFVHRSGWIPTTGHNFPTADEMTRPFTVAGCDVTLEPMWGCTPFNSYLLVARRRV